MRKPPEGFIIIIQYNTDMGRGAMANLHAGDGLWGSAWNIRMEEDFYGETEEAFIGTAS